MRARCWEILQDQRLECYDAIKRILFSKTDRLPPAILGLNQTYEACGCRRKFDFSEEAMIVMLYYIYLQQLTISPFTPVLVGNTKNS